MLLKGRLRWVVRARAGRLGATAAESGAAERPTHFGAVCAEPLAASLCGTGRDAVFYAQPRGTSAAEAAATMPPVPARRRRPASGGYSRYHAKYYAHMLVLWQGISHNLFRDTVRSGCGCAAVAAGGPRVAARECLSGGIAPRGTGCSCVIGLPIYPSAVLPRVQALLQASRLPTVDCRLPTAAAAVAACLTMLTPVAAGPNA